MRKRVLIILFFPVFFFVSILVYSSQWVRSGKLKNIMVTALTVSGDYIFAGAVGGVFRSSDDGANWISMNSGLPKKTMVLCITASSSNLLIGTFGHGIFLSTDNGDSWRSGNSGLTDLRVTCLLADDEKIFAATMGDGVFLSTNRGNSWTAVSFGLPKLTSINCLFKRGHRLFVGTDYRGLFSSADDGASWTEIKSRIPARNPVSCMTSRGDELFAGTVEGIFRSVDDGVSWARASSSLESMFLGLLPQTSVMSMAAYGPYVFAGTDGAGVYVPANRAQTWFMMSSGLDSTNVNALAVKGENLFAGTYDGVWRFPLSDVSLMINLSDPVLSDEEWETARKDNKKAVLIPKEIKRVLEDGRVTQKEREDIPFNIFGYLLLPGKDSPEEVALFSPDRFIRIQMPVKAPSMYSLYAVILFRAKNADLGYTPRPTAPPESIHQANLNVFVEFRQTDATGTSKAVREIFVPAVIQEDSTTYDPEKQCWYSLGCTLRPGNYTIAMALTHRSVPSTKKSTMDDLKKVGVCYFDIEIPGPESYQTSLETTPVFFIRRMEQLEESERITLLHKGMFTWSRMQVVPDIDRVVSPGEEIEIAYYVLGAKPKRKPGKMAKYDIEATYEIRKEDGKVAFRWEAQNYDFAFISQHLPLKQSAIIKDEKGERKEERDLNAGKYYLMINIKDKVSGSTVEKRLHFEVK